MEQTENYKLKKPAPEDFYDVADQNENMDIIDAALQEHGEALKNAPALDESGKIPKSQLPDFSTLELGETSSTAFRGDWGKLAYEHAFDGAKHISATERTAWNNKADLVNGKVPANQLPPMDYDPAGSAEAVQALLAAHTGNRSNPHGVTAAQVGATAKRTCRFVVGTSTAGWTKDDCDYLCNGVDDYLKIQAALDALPATGGEVLVLDGTYNFTGLVNIVGSNKTLRGSGAGTVLKRMYGEEYGVSNMIMVSGYSHTVTGFQIDGNAQQYTNSGHSIQVLNAQYAVISGNICYNTIGASVFITNSHYVKVFGNECDFNTTGILLSTTHDSSIFGNCCQGNSDRGISLRNSSGCTINGNVCYDNGIGIQFISHAEQCSVIGNTCCDNFGAGISIDSGGVVISGNTCFFGAGTPEDYVDDTGAAIDTIRVSGSDNLVIGNLIPGKDYVNSGTNNTFVNNKYN